MRVVYLHGFASSPRSSKAAFFAKQFALKGVSTQVPDLNAPDFRTLTVSRMLRQAAQAIGDTGEPVVLIGSSLGGFVAVQAALQHGARIQHVVLLAPALDFDGNRLSEMGDRGLEAWRTSDRLEVFHYGEGRMMPVHYELYADARRYDALVKNIKNVNNVVRLMQPVQVFQGRRDTSVDPATVERWAFARPNVELHMLDDDHQLAGSLDYIWKEVERELF